MRKDSVIDHGEDDEVVAIDQLDERRDTLHNADKPVSFIRLKNENHDLL